MPVFSVFQQFHTVRTDAVLREGSAGTEMRLHARLHPPDIRERADHRRAVDLVSVVSEFS